MNVWVDGNGSKSKELGLLYLPESKVIGRNRPNKVKKNVFQLKGDTLSTLKRKQVLQGVIKIGSNYAVIDNSGGIVNAALTIDKNETVLIYEAEFSLLTIRILAKQKNIEKGKLSFLIEAGVQRPVKIGVANRRIDINNNLAIGGISMVDMRALPPIMMPCEIFIKSMIQERIEL